MPAPTTQGGASIISWLVKPLRDKVQMANIYSEIMGSDHCPVSVELDL